MRVPELLFGALEELVDEDLKTFKWYLSLEVLDSCAPIPKSRLEKASRTDTVSKIIESYGSELAVDITIEILRKMKMNNVAQRLKNARVAGQTSASSSSNVTTPAATPAIAAQDGKVVIAPTLQSSSTGSWNITIHHK